MVALLETEHLTKRFGRIKAVQDLALHVEEGDIYGFLGLNGAGKTTAIRMILRLIRPDRGDVRIFGKSVKYHFIEIMERVGALVELPAYYPYLTGYKNLEILRLATGGVEPRRIEEVLTLVGLETRMHDRVRTYSQGMRQRLGIAMALLPRPRLVILDEPTNGLDPQGINHIRSTIRELNRREGVTFLISSHLLHEVEITCNRVGMIREGQLILEDKVGNILRDTASAVNLSATPHEKAVEIAKSFGEVRNGEDGSLRVKTDPARIPDLCEALAKAGVRIGWIHPERLSLEEIFLSKGT